ncbi:MAG: ATP-binding protein [Saprospiraceae bacterium]|nr:ATP-binding protein [Saprospiraceae bacterium]MCB9309773.1 ATP-binding protein [Lewinellaceae bacterium]
MLTINSNPKNIFQIESYLTHLGFKQDDDKYGDILISLTEAVNNAIIHGNAGDESKHVHILIKEFNDGISFCVSDEGSGFNPTKLPDPTCGAHLDACGGRGVHIMKSLSDNIKFENNGSTVEMFFSTSKSLKTHFK